MELKRSFIGRPLKAVFAGWLSLIGTGTDWNFLLRTDVTEQGSLEDSFDQVVKDLGGVNNW